MNEMTVKMMSFSRALELLKAGKCVSRVGWNGRGMYLYLVQGSTFEVNRPPLNQHLPEGTAVSYRAHIDMKCVDGTFVPWLASQSDLIEEDWTEVVINPAQDDLPIG
jgi:hypothetical protein